MVSEYTGGDPGADPAEEGRAAAPWTSPSAAAVVVVDPAAALERVRALHGECHARCGWCHECGSKIPCPTLRAIEGLIPPRIQHPNGLR